MHFFHSAWLLAALASAQFVSQDDRNLTTVRSPGDEKITVSYKEPEGVCRTAEKDQKQYTGWVNVPSAGDYPTNLFFWFVGAREPTDSLTIWLNGGPGSSSLYGFFTGNGPCEVVEKGLNEYDTVAREWGWDRASNMLFIDQPNQVGFSYNKPTNGTMNIPMDYVQQPPTTREADAPSWSVLNGTFSDMSLEGNTQTANTTELAAMAVWHMLQGLLTTMPQFKGEKGKSLDVHLFAESYGGRYGPIFAETFEEQNRKRLTGKVDKKTTRDINLVSLGIINGCIDREVQTPFYPVFANDNTYGIKALSNKERKYYEEEFSAKGGCKALLAKCAAAVKKDDPDGEGDEENVNEICASASDACSVIESPYYQAGRGAYDVAADRADPFPSMYFLEYLNQGSVQSAIGAPTNFSMSSEAVWMEFAETGDIARGGNIPRLAALLNSGVRIGLIYGDRDYICNWYGGEAVSLKLALEAGADYGNRFSEAGYADIKVNDSYVGGAVRQYGNLSFSRVYQAGHAVPAYQPETAFQIFSRIMSGKSVASGSEVTLSNYVTDGPLNSTKTEKAPKAPKPTCFVRSLNTCSREDLLLTEGDPDTGMFGKKGVVINGVLYAKEEDWPLFGKEKKKDDDDQDDGNKDDNDAGKDSGDKDGKNGNKDDDDSDEEGAATWLSAPGWLTLFSCIGVHLFLV